VPPSRWFSQEVADETLPPRLTINQLPSASLVATFSQPSTQHLPVTPPSVKFQASRVPRLRGDFVYCTQNMRKRQARAGHAKNTGDTVSAHCTVSLHYLPASSSWRPIRTHPRMKNSTIQGQHLRAQSRWTTIAMRSTLVARVARSKSLGFQYWKKMWAGPSGWDE